MANPALGLPAALDIDLEHIRAELTGIDLRIQREIRRWQLAGQDPADAFRGLYVADAEAEVLLGRPLGYSWGQTTTLEPDEVQAFSAALAEASRQVQLISETARQRGHILRLERLATAFGLNRFELDALLICLAPTLDLRYERLFGYLQDDVTRKRPTVNLVLNLLGPPGPERLLLLAHFAPEASLFTYHLLQRSAEPGQPLLAQTLTLDEAIVAWLLGDYQPHSDLGPHASLLQPQISSAEADALLAGHIQSNLAWADRAGERPLVVFYGPDRASQEATARLVAARLNRPLLHVDLAAAVKTDLSPHHVLRLALRDARLTGAVAYLSGWDVCLAAEGERREHTPAASLFAELCAHPDLAIVAGQAAWSASGVERDRHLFWLEFPVPAYSQRLALWQHFMGSSKEVERRGGEENHSTSRPTPHASLDISALAGQFLLTTAQIRDAVASAKDMAAQRGDLLQNRDLFVAARAHSNPNLGSLARKITPRYDWKDIILPADQLTLLREIIFTVRGRPQVLDEWGVGSKLASSQGVTVLFAGPPGTGKTMAAEVIAGELGLDLYKIDLSTVVSKYIGETEKNLERIFHEAASSNAILFFDEADAIFGKRSEVKDAHDRYANIEVSYLLQRMEAYDGVTILATNLRANLDEAFTRRLQFAVDFPFPEEADRLRIWQALFPPEVPHDPNLDFDLLARRFKLAGGSIRNVIINAAFLASADGGRVMMPHLLHGVRRELQKMGRLVGEDDLKLIVDRQ
ncbi:MAG: ATP-binding protein [Anaerolineales bacterium]|nr:ATP-binding protein [Anaerolineales bacterium]